MKKDKNWLEKQINKTLNIDGGSGERIGGFNKGLEFSLDLIDQLDEPEINEEQALNKLAESYPFSAEGINAILQAQIAGYSPVSTVKFVQPSEPELPVIPQFVADWYEGRKSSIYYHLCTAIESAAIKNSNSMSLNKFEFWLMDFENENIGKILNLKNGYTIEKEKMYRVKLPDVESESYNNLLGLRRTGDDRIVICKIKLSTFLHSDNVCFTEKEIKRNHEYLWQFAEEVSE